MNEPGTASKKLPPRIPEILLENNRFLFIVSWAALGTLIILLINLLRIGGNPFVFGLNSLIATILTIFAAGLAENLRSHFKDEPLSDQVWFFIMIGFGIWGVAEAFRLVFMVILRHDSTPALAWFWVLGFLPCLYGIYHCYRPIETTLVDGQRRQLLGIGAVGIAFIVGVEIIPAISRAYTADAVTIILVILYTFFDLALLLGALRIAISYNGIFSGPWSFFVIGFAVKFLGEVILLFPAQLGSGPSGWGNFLTSIANFAHYLWYIFPMLGMFVYDLVLSHKNVPLPSVKIKEEMLPNANALVFTDGNDTVIRTSLNFRYLLQLPDTIATSQVSLAELLGLSDETYQDLKTQLLRQEKAIKYVVESSYRRPGQKAWLTASVSYDPQKKYNGVDMVVQVLAEGVGGAPLTSEERALAENIFWLTGAQGEDSFKLLTDYFNAHYKLLSTLASRYEGSQRAAGLSEAVNQVAVKQKIAVRVLEQQIMVTGNVKIEDLGAAISILLKTARGYVTQLAGPEIVGQETDQLHQQMDRSTRSLVERFNLAK